MYNFTYYVHRSDCNNIARYIILKKDKVLFENVQILTATTTEANCTVVISRTNQNKKYLQNVLCNITCTSIILCTDLQTGYLPVHCGVHFRLPHVKKIHPTRKKRATSRNPLKTMSQFVEIQTEYIQINTGAAEKHQRKLKTEGCEC